MSQPESTGSVAEPPSTAPAAPRLGVVHLLLWTFCSALYLAVLRAIYAMQGDVGTLVMVQQTYGLLHAIITGAAITGTIALVSARVRGGPPLLWHPGHWLLFVAAITAVATLPLAFSFAVMGGAANAGDTYAMTLGLVFLFPPIAFAIAAQSQDYRARHWHTLFVALALVALSQSAFYFGLALSPGSVGRWMAAVSTIPTWGNVMLATAMLFVSLVELNTGPRRDWLHWTGVTTQMASACAILIWMFV
jgi:hypothetical protein